MDLRQLDDRLFVSPQLSLQDIPLLAAQGIKSIIANRPDGEDEDQSAYAAIEAAATAEGLAFRYLPLASGHPISDSLVSQFGEALDSLPGPLLAYCRKPVTGPARRFWPQHSGQAMISAA
jgi:sulfide:quinone oxidoreductase